MSPSDKDERRKYSRVDFATTTLMQLEVDGEKINFQGSSCDLSLKGVFISTNNRFALKTKCSIKIYLTGTIDKIELLMNGIIVRSDKSGVGIEFDSMDVDTYSHLKNIINYNSMDDSV